MKNYIIVTGGAGFIGSNLIELLLKRTNKKIISLDNYSSGFKKNHIKSSQVKYIKGDTINIQKHLLKYKNKIQSIFHFGEFPRIFQSFNKLNGCFKSNSIGSYAVFKFCLDNKIKLIYSATSASLGNNGNDKNLSPYSFTKSKNLEMLENLKKWFKFKFEVIYFYNVYGFRQIKKGPIATVVGIFEDQYKNNKKLTVVKPGTQTRNFTHIDDTVNALEIIADKGLGDEYGIANPHSYSINEVAQLISSNIGYLDENKANRQSSKILTEKTLALGWKPQKHLHEYIKSKL